MSKKVFNSHKSRSLGRLKDSAGRLFTRYGIAKVSVEEICRDAHVSKMTFYRYFSNKIDIAKAILNQMMEQGLVEYREIMDSDSPYPEKVAKIIHFKLEKTEGLGVEFVREFLSSPYPELHRLAEEWTKKFNQILRDDFVLAQKEGHIRGDIKPDFLMYTIVQMRNWAADPALTGQYASVSEMTIELVKLFYYGIMGESEEKEK